MIYNRTSKSIILFSGIRFTHLLFVGIKFYVLQSPKLLGYLPAFCSDGLYANGTAANPC
jgi:hypothetical protein